MKNEIKSYRISRLHLARLGRGVDLRKLRRARFGVGLCLRGTLRCHAGMCSGASEGVPVSVAVVKKPNACFSLPSGLTIKPLLQIKMMRPGQQTTGIQVPVPTTRPLNTGMSDAEIWELIPPLQFRGSPLQFRGSPSQFDPALVQTLTRMEATLSAIHTAVQNLATARQTGPVHTDGTPCMYACHKCATFQCTSKTALLQHQQACAQDRGRQKRNSKIVYVCGKCQNFSRAKRASVEAHESRCSA
jgi:hypothetical protein